VTSVRHWVLLIGSGLYCLDMATPSRLADVATLLPRRVEQHYGPDARVEALRAVCARWARRVEPIDAVSLAALETDAQTVFRHLELTLADCLEPEEHSTGWPPPDLAAARRAGAGIEAVRHRPDGSAVIELTELAPVAAAAPLFVGAFALVRHAGQVVLDLRGNGGGDPATAALIIDWLAAGPPRHLFDVRYRDRVRQWWTAGVPLAPAPSGPVRALIGPGTYSSGEALAWALQQQGLAELVGEPTRGAADHVVPLALTSDIRALIPEACVVAPGGGPTWEGVGVQPDRDRRPGFEDF
jgi:hypothetical protein